MKSLVKAILRILLSPFRWGRNRRDGVYVKEVRHEIPNDILLGLVRDELRNTVLDKDGHEVHHTATIWVKGYSMRPFLEHMRDKVILAYPSQPLQVGDAVLAEINPGHYVLHRIIRVEGERLTLMGDGNLGDAIERGVEHCRVQDVAGIVTHYVRPKRTLLASDEKLIRRIKRWRRWLPYRRYLLLLYKATI